MHADVKSDLFCGEHLLCHWEAVPVATVLSFASLDSELLSKALPKGLKLATVPSFDSVRIILEGLRALS